MTSWIRNHIASFYNFVSAPVASPQDALTNRLQSVRETAFSLYSRMMGNIGNGHDRLKYIVGKEARKEEEKTTEQK